MFYDEKVIDGVLHWRGTPDGAWQSCSASELTERLVNLRATVDKARATVNSWDLGVMDEIDCLRELDLIIQR